MEATEATAANSRSAGHRSNYETVPAGERAKQGEAVESVKETHPGATASEKTMGSTTPEMVSRSQRKK